MSSNLIFQHTAMTSGLLTHAELDEAIVALRTAGGQATTETQITDRQLADKLIELGHLTSYQAEQLLRGNRKLNLGPYRITDSIGQGGMGQVFKAEHMMMGRVVAVKVLPRSKSTPEAINSFTREIRAQAQLDHQNLVRAFDAGHDGNVYFLVTEYVPGTDLRRYVRTHGPLDMSKAATVISQAARGLQHAHTRGLIHRDVKPGNLLVTPEGFTKVSDLGLAGSLVDADDDPRAGKVVGTADYLSPEQILTPRQVGPPSDIYGLGCTLYYAVTGKVPYPGGTTKEKARRHCEGKPIDPRHFNPDLNDAFVDVIADMMEKDSQKRIQSATGVINRLAPWECDTLPTLEAEDYTIAPPPPLARSSRPPVLPDQDNGPVFPELLSADPGQLESPSQISQGTDAVASAGEETLPLVQTERGIFRGHGRRIKFGIKLPQPGILLVAGLVIIIFILLFVLWKLW